MQNLKHLHQLRISFRAFSPVLRGGLDAFAVFLHEVQQVPALQRPINAQNDSQRGAVVANVVLPIASSCSLTYLKFKKDIKKGDT